ncbi:hypothetical protein GGS20DRAFT_563088 [Poronia punctata]|nr:hypothetical protein GGS20DRAFT_563088 [Poronia punctata]
MFIYALDNIITADLRPVIGGVFAPVHLFMLPSYDPMPEAASWRKRGENFDHLGTGQFCLCCRTIRTPWVPAYLWSCSDGTAQFRAVV